MIPILVKFKYTEAQFRKACALQLRYLVFSRKAPLAHLGTSASKLLMIAGIMFIVIGIYATVVIGLKQLWVVGLLGVLMVVLPVFESWAIRRRFMKLWMNLFKDVDVHWSFKENEITSTLISCASTPHKSSFGWELLTEVVEGSGGFLVVLNHRDVFWIPCDGFCDTSQIGIFRSVITSKKIPTCVIDQTK